MKNTLFTHDSATINDCIDTLYNNTTKQVGVEYCYNQTPESYGQCWFDDLNEFLEFIKLIGIEYTEVKLINS